MSYMHDKCTNKIEFLFVNNTVEKRILVITILVSISISSSWFTYQQKDYLLGFHIKKHSISGTCTHSLVHPNSTVLRYT